MIVLNLQIPEPNRWLWVLHAAPSHPYVIETTQVCDSLLFLTYNAFVVDHVDGNQCEKRTTKLYW